MAVYLDQAAGAGGVGATSDSLYKSSDDKILAGVCAGLAHGWKISCPGMRIATVAVTLFTGVPLILYIVCIFVLPARPTKNAA